MCCCKGTRRWNAPASWLTLTVAGEFMEPDLRLAVYFKRIYSPDGTRYRGQLPWLFVLPFLGSSYLPPYPPQTTLSLTSSVYLLGSVCPLVSTWLHVLFSCVFFPLLVLSETQPEVLTLSALRSEWPQDQAPPSYPCPYPRRRPGARRSPTQGRTQATATWISCPGSWRVPLPPSRPLWRALWDPAVWPVLSSARGPECAARGLPLVPVDGVCPFPAS